VSEKYTDAEYNGKPTTACPICNGTGSISTICLYPSLTLLTVMKKYMNCHGKGWVYKEEDK